MSHITPAEAALGAAVVTAAAGVIGGLVVNAATKARAHVAWLWKQEVKVYEYVLIQANNWHKMRDVSTFSQEFTPVDSSESKKLYIRLQMFGAPEIFALYDTSMKTQFHWLGLLGTDLSIEDETGHAEKQAEIKAAKVGLTRLSKS